jgi:HSP20 family protein
MEKRIPKDLVRKYTMPEGGKVREVGPMRYRYSMTVGPEGKPRIREFGSQTIKIWNWRSVTKPEIT